MLLSPALRLFPTASAMIAGPAGWLSALLGFFPAAAYTYCALRLFRLRREDEGLPQLLMRAAPGRAGRAVVLLLGLWALIYTAFILRSGADRFIVAVFPDSPRALFVLSMGAAALAAALTPLRCAARSAKLFAPAVLGTLLVVLLAALLSLRAENLVPVGVSDAPRVLAGALPVMDLLTWVVLALSFFLPECASGSFTPRRALLCTLGVCVTLSLMSADIVGVFGAALTGELSWPFFTLVRSLVFFRSIERIEALVVALWIFPDFLIVSLFLRAARDCLFAAIPRLSRPGPLSGVCLPLLAAAAAGLGMIVAPQADGLFLWSQRIVPAANLFFTLVLLPGVLGLGAIKKRL